MSRTARRMLAALVMSVASACSSPSGPGGGDTTHITPPPVVKLSTIDVVGQTPMTATPASATMFYANGHYSNGSMQPLASVTWASSDSTVAKVNTSGLVTALKAGNGVISATADGVTGTFPVTVVNPPPTVVKLEILVQSPITVPAQVQFQCGQRLSDNTFRQVNCLWASLQPSIATMTSGGLFSANKAGQAPITATYDSKTDTATITVLPPPAPPGWNELTAAEQAYAKLTNIDFYGGKVTRFTKEKPALIYAPTSSDADKADALIIIDSITGGGFARFVSSASEANVFAKNDVWPPPGYNVSDNPCGVARATQVVQDVIVQGEVYIRPDCILVDGSQRNYLAHELLHVMGFQAHTGGGSDILGQSPVWKTSPLLIHVGHFLYGTPQGTSVP